MMGAAAPASPASAASTRRSNSIDGIISMRCNPLARARSKPKIAPAARLAKRRRLLRRSMMTPRGNARTSASKRSSKRASARLSRSGGSGDACDRLNQRMRLFLKDVAAAAYGHDVPGDLRVLFDLFAQPAHVHADGLLLAFKVVSPDFVEQYLPRDDAAVILHEHAQQRELFGSQGDFFAADHKVLARWVEHDSAKHDSLFAAGCR